ncbi:MAG: sigma-70 family RNA polymerase sigma factor, partial [Planctomycetota bacterium]
TVRMDPRLASRLDASDVVQDALLLASKRLDEYRRDRPMEFYPWLRRLAFERLIQMYRHHVERQKRSVNREEHETMQLSNHSAVQLVERVVTNDTSPSGQAIHAENLDHARHALEQLSPEHREVLVLRHLEQLSLEETAAVVGVAVGTIKSRHFRALAELHRQLIDESTRDS